MGKLFDDITRVVGSQMPRRSALRFIASALAGGTLTAFGFPRSVSACVACPSGSCCDTLVQCRPGGGCCSGTSVACPTGSCCGSLAQCLPISGCCSGTSVACPTGSCCGSAAQCLPISGCCTGTSVACPTGSCCGTAAQCLPVSGCCTGASVACPTGSCCGSADQCRPGGGCCSGTSVACPSGSCCGTAAQCIPGGGCCSGTSVACPSGSCCDTLAQCRPGGGCCPRSSTFAIEGYYSDHIDILVQNDDSGLGSITVAEAINCTVSIPKFDGGTTDPVEVTATKIDLNSRSRVVLTACPPSDCGCEECCDEGDPVLTQLEIPAQGSSETIQLVKETFTEIPRKESFISIQNGAHGLERLRIQVNDKTFGTLRLEDGDERSVDVVSMMKEGENRITLIGYGEAGAKALILISDVAANNGGKSSNEDVRLQRRLLWQGAQRQPGQNLTWGR